MQIRPNGHLLSHKALNRSSAMPSLFSVPYAYDCSGALDASDASDTPFGTTGVPRAVTFQPTNSFAISTRCSLVGGSGASIRHSKRPRGTPKNPSRRGVWTQSVLRNPLQRESPPVNGCPSRTVRSRGLPSYWCCGR